MFPEIPCVHHPIKKKCFLNRKENGRERAQGSERLVEWSGGAGEGKGGGRAVGMGGARWGDDPVVPHASSTGWKHSITLEEIMTPNEGSCFEVVLVLKGTDVVTAAKLL